jgi:hypothetical protein
MSVNDQCDCGCGGHYTASITVKCLLLVARSKFDSFSPLPGSSQQISHACNIPLVVCLVPPEDEKVMLKTCRGC